MNDTQEVSKKGAAPLIVAPLSAHYTGFVQCEPPHDGSTTRAWLGKIQPFRSDSDARFILSEIEAGRQLWVSDGHIRGGSVAAPHWADPLLVNMDVVCEVLVCEQPAAVPRAYLLSPLFLEHYANPMPRTHPHPRGDHAIRYRKHLIPGLCIFSGAEFIFESEISESTQFLDQLTQYVAKHLIWLRTRRLIRSDGEQTMVLLQPPPGELIIEQRPQQHTILTPHGPKIVFDFWTGYWPGEQASAITPLQHLRQIKLDQRCWCGAYKNYGECHRDFDLMQLAPCERFELEGEGQSKGNRSG